MHKESVKAIIVIAWPPEWLKALSAFADQRSLEANSGKISIIRHEGSCMFAALILVVQRIVRKFREHCQNGPGGITLVAGNRKAMENRVISQCLARAIISAHTRTAVFYTH